MIEAAKASGPLPILIVEKSGSTSSQYECTDSDILSLVVSLQELQIGCNVGSTKTHKTDRIEL
jgi:hypothetical protein